MSETNDPNANPGEAVNTSKKPGLKITGIGKLLLIVIGIAILMPFIGVSLAVVFGLIIGAIALGLGLVAAVLAVLLAVLAAILHSLGVVIPWPMGPW